jgi:hypothetical protein
MQFTIKTLLLSTALIAIGLVGLTEFSPAILAALHSNRRPLVWVLELGWIAASASLWAGGGVLLYPDRSGQLRFVFRCCVIQSIIGIGYLELFGPSMPKF